MITVTSRLQFILPRQTHQTPVSHAEKTHVKEKKIVLF